MGTIETSEAMEVRGEELGVKNTSCVESSSSQSSSSRSLLPGLRSPGRLKAVATGRWVSGKAEFETALRELSDLIPGPINL